MCLGIRLVYGVLDRFLRVLDSLESDTLCHKVSQIFKVSVLVSKFF